MSDAPPKAHVATKPALGDALRKALSADKRITAWQTRRFARRGLQTYLVKTQPESTRWTQGETYDVAVFVKNGDQLGRAGVTLGPGDASQLASRIDEAVYMAGLGGDTPWALPGAGTKTTVEMYDPALGQGRVRATSQQLVGAWRDAVNAMPGVRPSSMELFCGEEATRLENSAGLSVESTATRVSLLTLLLASGEKAAERYSWDERRRAADLDVKGIVQRAGQEALDLTHAIVPPSGQYPVLIDADELVGFLAPIENNTSAEQLYEKSSRFEVGKPLPIEAKNGEPLNVWSNAVAPYGLDSYAFDNNGVAGQRIQLIKDGVFVHPWATKQYADYLGTTPTGGFANWELPTGKASLAELTSGDGPILYVRSFSWLTPDQARGNFGSEVRVGYLYEKGVKKPVKGGTVSGSVFSALGNARYASDAVFRGNYMGPAAVRFEGLTVTGA